MNHSRLLLFTGVIKVSSLHETGPFHFPPFHFSSTFLLSFLLTLAHTGSAQALERQKEYTDAIRIERDELREEVVTLKDILKVFGVLDTCLVVSFLIC